MGEVCRCSKCGKTYRVYADGRKEFLPQIFPVIYLRDYA